MVFTARILLFVIVLLTPFFGGGRLRLAEEFWLLTTGFVAFCASLAAGRRALFRVGGVGALPKYIAALLGRSEGWLVFFILGSFFATAWSPARDAGFMPWLSIFAGGLLFFSARLLLAEKKIQVVFARALMIATFGFVTIGFWIFVTGDIEYFTSLFFFPGVMAGWLLLVLPIVIAEFAQAEKPAARIALSLIVAVFLTAFILTGVRGGFAVALVLILVFGVMFTRAAGRKTVFALALFAVAAFGASFLFSFEKNRAARETGDTPLLRNAPELVDSSTKDRLVFWQGATQMFIARPVAGWGLGTFASVWPRYQPDSQTFARWPHSAFFEILAETGILGIVPFLGFLVVFFRDAFRHAARALCDGRFLELGFVTGLFGLMLHASLDVDFHYPAVWGVWWVVAGMFVSIPKRAAFFGGEQAVPRGQARAFSFPSFFLAAGGIVVMLAAVILLRAASLRTAASGFALRSQFVAAARLAHDAAQLSRSADDNLQEGIWYLAQESAGGERMALGRRAVEAAEYARVRVPFDASSFALEGEAKLRLAEDFEGAVQSFSEALWRDPYNHPEYAEGKIRTLFMLGRAIEAERTIFNLFEHYDNEAIEYLVVQARRFYTFGGILDEGPHARLRVLARLARLEATIKERAGDAEGNALWSEKARYLEELAALDREQVN